MDNNTLQNLTTNIDMELVRELNTNYETVTNILYPDIKKLLDLTPEMRKQLLSKWKYYNAFIQTINEHSDNHQTNSFLNWNQSFTMSFLYSLYH